MLTIRTGDDDGNVMIVVVLIIAIVALMASTLMVTIQGGFVAQSSSINGAAARAAAEAALSDALFQIDQNPPSSEFCVGASSSCIAQAVPNLAAGASAEYTATPTANGWKVAAEGDVRGTHRTIEVDVTRQAEYPYVVYGSRGLNFDGGADGFYSYDSSNGTAPTSGPVGIASSGPIDCHGGVGSNVTRYYYANGGATNGDCSAAAVALSSVYQAPSSPAPSTNSGCPNGGSLGSTNGVASLAAGSYVCTGPVSIAGTLTLSGPVQLWIEIPSADNTSSLNALSIADGSVVNAAGLSASPVTYPDAGLLRIYSNAIGTIGDSNGQSGYTLAAIVDAPEASITTNGCSAAYYGSLVVGSLRCHGGPHLQMYYDQYIQQNYSVWQQSDYQMLRASAVQLP